ncbi:TrlF family AAA-like ATPase [Treponema sp.]|uniref:TrlF family AAA-like ATPase n=1 Tax=Treponema sp. TaxID=166 RepID=UPI003FD6EEB4
MTERNTRGSEWHKWDLHIHTPFTGKNDQFQGKDPNQKWELFLNKIEENNDVKVLGITDYFSIDNYLYLCELQKKGRIQNVYLIPNVELRILPVTRTETPINIHVLFDPEFDIEIIKRDFFNRLTFEYLGSKYQCNKKNIIQLGYALNENKEIDNNKAYTDGLNQFNISFNDLRDVLKSAALKDHFYVGVANSANDGNSGIKDNALTATRKEIYRLADFIFSANPKDIDYFLGNGCDSIEKIISNYGSIKPCIRGCDAHSLEKMFTFEDNRYTWIKAEPTFEGFRQIFFEPKERVYIGEKIMHKNLHYVIDSIEIDDDNFQKEKIIFNENLNCIIGGKSTGKSILLRTLAKTINSQYVDEQESHYTTVKKNLEVNNTRVLWQDGSDSERKIIYIPQTFLNNIVDDNQDNNPIKEIIENTLLQDKGIQTAKNELEQNISQITSNLRNDVLQLCQKLGDIQNVRDKILSIGDSRAYETIIKQLENERNKIATKGDVSVSEIAEYESLEKRLELIKSEISNDETVEKNITLIKAPIAFVPEWFEKNTFGSYELSNKYFGKYDSYIRSKFSELNEKLSKEWDTFKLSMIAEIKKDKIKNQNENENIQKDFIVLKTKITIDNRVKEINEKIKKENSVLQNIKKLKEDEKNIENQILTYRKNIIDTRKKYLEAYDKYCKIINDSGKSLSGNLVFTAQTVWQKDNFMDVVTSSLNQSYFGKFRENNHYDLKELKDNEYGDDLLNRMIIAITSNKKEEMLPLKASMLLENVLIQLLGNWYTVHYDIKSGNDTIEVMSPGKKASVLLELLISKANCECPILIDQPEDDLDNRSIYNDLAKYLRNKKIDRQIIIVTHNANLVLGSDAEEIIIANQNGADSKNDNYRFEYRSGAIENNYFDSSLEGILYKKGIQEQICDILEGGTQAFKNRENKYKSIIL